jgi:hypothetical protein
MRVQLVGTDPTVAGINFSSSQLLIVGAAVPPACIV